MTERVIVDQIVAAAPARVVMTRDAAGQVTEAGFDLTGLPRVDALLAGRPVVEVPGLVERLCGICPTAHHLAGTRALEALAGMTELPATAEAVRRLLHHAGIIAIHVVGLVATARDDALALRRFAKAVMAAAGSPGHFPATAVPGGVVAPVGPAQRDTCRAMVPDALAAARRIADRALAAPVPPDHFAGADLALVDDRGNLDLYGQTLRAVAADGAPVIAAASADQWDDLVAEADPGSSAPRPYLKALGPGAGAYRVGPVAQLRVGRVGTPSAAGLQERWWGGADPFDRHARHDDVQRRVDVRTGGAAAARTIIIVHAVEAIADLLDSPALVAGPTLVDLVSGQVLPPGSPPSPWPAELPPGVGVGWVDGARGLLAHRYATGADGRVATATILTPTAQNEPWLGELLRTAAGGSASEAAVRAGLEDAIREADPCLPCSAAPAGTMDLVVDITEGC